MARKEGRSGSAAAGRPGLTASQIQRWYVRERRRTHWIAAHTGWSSQYVRDRLRDAGILLRPAGSPKAGTVDAAKLAAWSAQGLSLSQIAAHTGYSPSGVFKLLAAAGLPTRSPRRPAGAVDPALLAEMPRLYRDEGRSLAEIGAVFGHGPDWARARVIAAGWSVRASRAPRWDLEQLRHWRIGEQLTVTEIAGRAGRAPATIAEALRNAGIVTPPRRRQPTPIDVTQLRALYVEERCTLTQVAAELGCTTQRTRAALDEARLPIRPARTRADLPPPAEINPEQLTDL